MFKKIFYLLCLLLISNCTPPGTAFLGPMFTGAKTGSVYQATLSYGSGRIVNEIKQSNSLVKPDQIKIKKSPVNKDPIILLSYVVNKIEISNVQEPEPLP